MIVTEFNITISQLQKEIKFLLYTRVLWESHQNKKLIHIMLINETKLTHTDTLKITDWCRRINKKRHTTYTSSPTTHIQ